VMSLPIGDVKCDEKYFERLFEIPLSSRQVIVLHRKCMHNEYVGLNNRYLAETPNAVTYDVDLVTSIVEELAGLIKPHFEGPISLETFVTNKKGKLGNRYREAVKSVLQDGFNLKRHNIIKAFLKTEVFNEESKPPRNIMGRDTRFNLLYGLFTTPLEHAMMKVPGIMKGKNLKARGLCFQERIYGEHYYEWDMSKFEASQREEILLHIELLLWKLLLTPEDHKLISQIFEAKMQKKGYFPTGLLFEFLFCRGSGDMDTGLFNTILNWVAAKYFEIKNNLPQNRFAVDGDDGVGSVPRDMDKSSLKNTFVEFGFTAKLFYKTDYHDVDFCSGKFLMYNKSGDFTLVNNLNKVLNNVGFLKTHRFDHCTGQYYSSLGYMYSILYPNFPIFSDLSKFLMSFSKAKVNTEILDFVNPMYSEIFKLEQNQLTKYDIDVEFMHSEYYLSFGLGPAEIENIMKFLRNHTVKLPDNRNRTIRTRGAGQHIEQLNYSEAEQLLKQSCVVTVDIESRKKHLNKIRKRCYYSGIAA